MVNIERLEFRLAQEEDISQMVEIMNAEYRRKKNSEYFRWQYFNSYYPTVLYCAFENEKLIGMFGLQKRKLNNGVKVGQAIDLLVIPEWRGKGVFFELGKHAIEHFKDLDILCVFPNLKGKRACEKTLNWKTISRINSLVLERQAFKKLSLIEIRKLGLKLIKDKYLMQFEYNEEINSWRFDNNPEYEYYKISSRSGIYAITKLFRDPVEKKLYGDIVNFKWNFRDEKLFFELVFKAINFLFDKGVELITTWSLPHTEMYKFFTNIGFKEVEQERYFCLDILKRRYKFLYDIKRWNFVQSDAEIY